MVPKAAVGLLVVPAFIVAWLLNYLLVPGFAHTPIAGQAGGMVVYAAMILLPSGAVARLVFKTQSSRIWAWWMLASVIAGVMMLSANTAAKISAGGFLL